MVRLIYILLSMVVPLLAMAQAVGAPRTFVNIATDASANEVYYSLCQDSTGMMWLGSNMGLCSYDGYQVKQHFAKGQPSNTRINSIVLRDGRLYTGTDIGVQAYDLQEQQYVPTDAQFPADVRSLAFDAGQLWVGSLWGLYRYDLATRQLQEMAQGLPHSAVYAVCLTQQGDIYVGTYNGLCRYDRQAQQFEKIEIAAPAQQRNLFVNALADDPRRGCLWIGTEGALYRYSYSTSQAQSIEQFNGQSVKSLAIDRRGHIVAGTDNGLFVHSERHTELYQHDSRIATSLANNVVWGVMVDRDGNLWAGTETGVSVAVTGSDFIAMPIYQLTGSSEGSRFYNILRDSRGYLWLGGTNGIIRYSRHSPTKWYMMGSKDYPLKHNRIRSICEDSRYGLWIATDGGVNRYDYVTEQFVNYEITDSSRTYNANWAYGIVEDQQGQMWVGAYLGGLFAADRDQLVEAGGGAFMAPVSYNSANGLPNNLINQLVILNDGSKWASLFNAGVLVRIGSNQSLKVVTLLEAKKAYVQYIAPDHQRQGLWCGYLNGFAHLAADGTVRQRYTFPADGDIDVLAMAVVGRNLWLSTSQGIWVMDTERGQMKHLRLPGNNYTSLYYDRALRRMLIGGYEQVLIVDPEITSKSEPDREIRLTAVLVNDEPYKLSAADTMLCLSHEQNRIAVEFSDLDLRLNNRKSFEYRIVGLNDGDWTTLPPGNNCITATDVEPGQYTIEIRPLDSGSTYVKRLAVTIAPAWYSSWWAIAIYVALGVLLAVWFINFSRLRLRLRMERVRSEKTLEMANSRMEFLTNISHELKTPLSMIIGPLSKMLNDQRDPDVHRHLDAIQQNALKLNSMIHRILEVNRMDNNPDNLLIYSQVEMVGFCRSIFDTYKEGFPGKQFVFTSSDSRLLVNADAVKMESVINNLLSNACKYSGDDAMIAMSVERRADGVAITISDNGVGIPQAELPLIFQRLYQSSATKGHKEGTGIGLYLVKTYVEMHQGTIQVVSHQGEGAAFTVTIPGGNVEENAEAEIQQDAEAAEQPDRLRVLIVEDNAAIANFVRDILKDQYSCTIAHNGKAGLAVCATMQPHLIIADMMMPVMDGLEMCRRIKRNQRLAAVPIILLTAKDDRITEAESIKAGIDVFMSKPFEAHILVARVQQLLKSKEIMRSNLRVEEITTVREETVESPDEKMLATITSVIEDNIADPEMNVAYVSQKAGISQKQLYRLLKGLVGVAPVDYIRQARMKKAAMLLAQRKFTISEVMYMVGFSSSSYFSKCFSAQFGCTPRQYADQQQ